MKFCKNLNGKKRFVRCSVLTVSNVEHVKISTQFCKFMFVALFELYLLMQQLNALRYDSSITLVNCNKVSLVVSVSCMLALPLFARQNCSTINLFSSMNEPLSLCPLLLLYFFRFKFLFDIIFPELQTVTLVEVNCKLFFIYRRVCTELKNLTTKAIGFIVLIGLKPKTFSYRELFVMSLNI